LSLDGSKIEASTGMHAPFFISGAPFCFIDEPFLVHRCRVHGAAMSLNAMPMPLQGTRLPLQVTTMPLQAMALPLQGATLSV